MTGGHTITEATGRGQGHEVRLITKAGLEVEGPDQGVHHQLIHTDQEAATVHQQGTGTCPRPPRLRGEPHLHREVQGLRLVPGLHPQVTIRPRLHLQALPMMSKTEKHLLQTRNRLKPGPVLVHLPLLTTLQASARNRKPGSHASSIPHHESTNNPGSMSKGLSLQGIMKSIHGHVIGPQGHVTIPGLHVMCEVIADPGHVTGLTAPTGLANSLRY